MAGFVWWFFSFLFKGVGCVYKTVFNVKLLSMVTQCTFFFFFKEMAVLTKGNIGMSYSRSIASLKILDLCDKKNMGQ